MRLLSTVSICIVVCLALPFAAFGQVSPEAAGAQPLSANFDVWPDSTNFDEGASVVQIAGLGPDPITGNPEWAVYGMDEDSGGPDAGCGPVKTVISKNGITHPKTGGHVADDGFDFWQQAAIIGAGVGASGFGFFASAGANGVDGNFVGGIIIYSLGDVKALVLDPGPHPLANFAYVSTGGADGNEDYGTWQVFDRNGAPVSLLTYGRNLPAGNHVNDPNYATRARSRVAGCDVLSDGNVVFNHRDRSSPSPGGIAGAAGTGEANMFSVTNAAATTFIKSTTTTYRRPDNTTFSSGAASGTAGGEGFFACYGTANGGSLSIFRNDGTRISQVLGVQTFVNNNAATLLPAGFTIAGTVGSGEPAAAGGNYVAVPLKYQNPATPGINRPCVARWEVNVGALTATALPAFIADDDTTPLASIATDSHYGVNVDNNGRIAVCWKSPNFPALPPVCRVFRSPTDPAFNPASPALTPSFFVSSLFPATDDTSVNFQGDDFVKPAFSGNGQLAVLFMTENGIDTDPVNAGAQLGTDCYGLIKPNATVARVFQLEQVVDVKDWDLY